MRIPVLLMTIALLAACSEEAPAPQAAAAQQLTVEQALAGKAPAAQPAAAPTEKAELAAAEATETTGSAPDACDLSGYDMSKMTAEQHGELEKACARSKQ